MMPRAQRLIGLRFDRASAREALMGFLPARALSAKALFFFRSSNWVGCHEAHVSVTLDRKPSSEERRQTMIECMRRQVRVE